MRKLPLQAGSQVLDVGSGLGGTVEYMAKVIRFCHRGRVGVDRLFVDRLFVFIVSLALPQTMYF